MKVRRRSGPGATRRLEATEDPEVDQALDAMSAPELRAAIRVVLDELDDGVKDSIIDALLARGAKATSGWRPTPRRAAEILGPGHRNRAGAPVPLPPATAPGRGALTSLFGLMGIELSAPDHSTLSRRGQHLDLTRRRVPTSEALHLIVGSTGLSVVGEEEWAAAKHGQHGWKKLHLGVDAAGVILVHTLTEATVDDATTGVDLEKPSILLAISTR